MEMGPSSGKLEVRVMGGRVRGKRNHLPLQEREVGYGSWKPGNPSWRCWAGDVDNKHKDECIDRGTGGG